MSNQIHSDLGDFSFMRDEYWRRCLKLGYDHITELNIWEFLKTHNPPFGKKYVAWQEPEICALKKVMENELKHFTRDFETFMRTMEYIAKYGWEQYIERMNYHN